MPTSRQLVRRLSAPVVGALALLATQTAAAPAASAAQHRLLPDITTLRIDSGDLVVRSGDSRTLLRLSNRIANRGRGPLEIHPTGKSHDCDGDGDPSDDRDALQRVFLDTNRDHVFERGVDTASDQFRFGCERYDPHAHHWNVFDLARYELRRLHSGKTVARTRKVAFCTVDTKQVFPGLPGSPNSGYYPRGGCDEHSTLGVSVGWEDEYYYGLPGQDLNVTGVKAGRYCLVSSADPDNLLRESDNSNNTRRMRIELRPGKGQAKVLRSGCRLGG